MEKDQIPEPQNDESSDKNGLSEAEAKTEQVTDQSRKESRELKETISPSLPTKLQISTRNEIAQVLNKEEDILKDPVFDEKFKNSISIIESEKAGPTRMIDIRPESTPIATIFLAPGWLETLIANKYFIKSLVDFGYRVVSLQHPRKGGKSSNPKERRTDAIKTILEKVDTKVFIIGHSLGAIDTANHLDPKTNPEAHKKIEDVILTNPGGINKKKYGLIKLLSNYKKHMKQKKEANKQISKAEKSNTQLETTSGIPFGKKETALRKSLDSHGGKELSQNFTLAFREALLVSRTKIQDELQRIREEGHQVHVFTNEDDKLFPHKEFDLKVKTENNEEIANIDSLTISPGYHNTPRNALNSNPQWQSLIMIDNLIKSRIEEQKTLKT